MRMIGLGLLAFLLAGVATTISYLDLWQRGWRQVENLALGPRLVFEGREAMDSGRAGAPRADLYRVDPEGSLLLSGFPAYQRTEYRLPVLAGADAGVLDVHATVQAAPGVEGLLRVSVNNSRRGEYLLRPGEAAAALRIPLTPDDLAGDRVTVGYRLIGNSPLQPCGETPAPAVVVEIEPTSRLSLTLDRPLSDPRDRVLAWGEQLRVSWPEGLAGDERARRMALAADLARRGFEVVVVAGEEDRGLTGAQLRLLLAAAVDPLADAGRDEAAAWPVALAGEGANAGARHFRGETTWRTRFGAGDLPGREMPGALDLSLLLGPLPAQAEWTVSVTLNGGLIHVERAGAGALTRRIDLDGAAFEAANVIEVTAASSHDPEGLCNGGPELVAELTEETRLLGGGPIHDDAMSRLQDALRARDAIHLGPAVPLGATDATALTRLLARVVPAGVDLRTDAGGADAARAVVLPRGSSPVHSESAQQWLVWSEGPGLSPVAAPLDEDLAARLAGRSPLAILLELPARQLAGDLR